MSRKLTVGSMLLVILAICMCPEPTLAHPGERKTDLILAQARAGAYLVTLQARPAIGAAFAEADVLLPGQTVDGQPLPMRGTVEFAIAPLGADGRVRRPWTTAQATWDGLTGHYRAPLPINASGQWAVRVIVDGTEGRAEVSDIMYAYQPRDVPQTSLLLLLVMLPALALGVTALILRALQVPIFSTAEVRQS